MKHLAIVAFFVAAIFFALADVKPLPGQAQAVPTSQPTTLIVPTTAPTTSLQPQTPPPPVPRATSTATTAPITVYDPQTAPPPIPVPTTTATTAAVQTTVPAYATTVPGPPVPTIIPGTPPPFTSTAYGCSFFPAGDRVYNSEVYDAPKDPDSDAMIASFTAVASGNVQISGANGSWPVNVATAATPAYPLVTTGGTSVAGIADFPFGANSTWQGQGDTRPEDHHLLTLDTSDCALYEAYVSGAEPPASWNVVGGKLVQSEPYGMRWDLTKPYPATVASGVNAGMVPHVAGMVRWDDMLAGCVCHALNIDVKAHALRSSAFVFPARRPEAANYYTGPIADAATALPLGSHLRLKASYKLVCPSTATDGCWQASLVVKALQVTGGYVMDTGGYSGVVYFAMQTRADGSKYFPFDVHDIAALNAIPMSAFEVVPPPGCASVAACLNK